MNSKQLIALAEKYQGEYNAIYKAYLNNEIIEESKTKNAITILDENYPSILKELKNPPLVLFYKGDIKLLNEICVGVVGSRLASIYATKVTKELVNVLKERYTIVSGMAKGIDSIAQIAALDHKTIAVLGSGIDYIYPYSNKDLYESLAKGHLIISEYPGYVKPLAYHFPIRNRIIAALSQKLFVMQSSLKSGTLITVNEALNLGRDIYALPYAIDDKCGLGTNMLIEEGANMILYDNFCNY